MPHLLAIHIDGGLDMRTLQEQRDTLVTPALGHINTTTIPSLSHIMFLWRQEEWEFHLTLLPVGFHIGVEVETGVIERARPLGVDIHIVALAVGQHRARQLYLVMIAGCLTYSKIPDA